MNNQQGKSDAGRNRPRADDADASVGDQGHRGGRADREASGIKKGIGEFPRAELQDELGERVRGRRTGTICRSGDNRAAEATRQSLLASRGRTKADSFWSDHGDLSGWK